MAKRRKTKNRKPQKQYLNGLLVFFILVSVAAIVYILSVQEQKTGLSPHKKEPQAQASQKQIRQPQQKEKAATDKIAEIISGKKKDKDRAVVSKIEKIPLPRKQIAVIIDDIGYDLAPVRELMQIKADITFSVLPFLPHSRAAAEILRQGKKEILLHLPMEPVTYPADKPGEGALFTDMNEKEILHQLEKNLEAVPYVAGVNNHMGSKFMTDREKLALVFGRLKKKNLYFVDSRTAAESEAAAAAKAVGLPMAERKIFIDNKRDYDEIYKNIMSVKNYENDPFPVIVIGHPYPETIRALKDASKALRDKGILIVPVSQLVKPKSPPGVS